MIILAAGQGTRLRPLTDDRPKCMVELWGKPLLYWQIQSARAAGIDEITIIGGYRLDQLECYGADTIENPRYATTNMVETLFCAENQFDNGFIMAYGDIVYSPETLTRLLNDTSEIAVVADRKWQGYWEQRFDDVLSDAESFRLAADGRRIVEIGQTADSVAEIQAQYIGLVAFRGNGVHFLRQTYNQEKAAFEKGKHFLSDKRKLDRLYMTDLLNGLIRLDYPVHWVPIDRGWVEIDDPTDLALAQKLTAPQNNLLSFVN